MIAGIPNGASNIEQARVIAAAIASFQNLLRKANIPAVKKNTSMGIK